ncbi:MAG TPA: hypothetical protein VGX23_22025 [Actinocrinis sp.]|nr:hypothetical protein [Actinocrinis sp.]
MKEQPKSRPVPLFVDLPLAEPESPRFFGLEEITDAGELLRRACDLADAFRAAADRAAAYQAIAAADLTDPRRFDRITFADLAARTGLTEAAAETLAERGRQLLKGAQPPGHGF